ncbi:aminotransferase, partial [Streptomyces sp. NPDC058255]
METFETLVRAEFAPENTYLNTASTGLVPARTVAAMRAAVESVAAGQPADMFADVEAGGRALRAPAGGGRTPR